MAIRITNSMMSRGFLHNVNGAMRRMDHFQTKLYTGKEINRLSDDPLNLQTLLRVDTSQVETTQYMTNLEFMLGVHGATEAALNTIIEVVSRMRTLAVAALNDTNTSDERHIMAADVASMLEHLIDVGNAEYQGTFIFAGTDFIRRPFTLNTEEYIPTYTNPHELNREPRFMEIGNDVIFKFNRTAFDIFGDEVEDPDAIGDGNLLATMRRFAQALLLDGEEHVFEVREQMETALAELHDHFHRINHIRSEYGTLEIRMRATHTRHFNALTTLNNLRHTVEDADLAEAIMHLKSQETVFRAALETGARLLPPTLVDYLR